MHAAVLDRVVAELLDRGEADWVPMSVAWWVARSAGGASSDQEARDLAIEAISRALLRGVMELGDVTERNGFRAWALPVGQVIERLKREWSSDDGRPELGAIGWLNTVGIPDPRSANAEKSS